MRLYRAMQSQLQDVGGLDLCRWLRVVEIVLVRTAWYVCKFLGFRGNGRMSNTGRAGCVTSQAACVVASSDGREPSHYNYTVRSASTNLMLKHAQSFSEESGSRTKWQLQNRFHPKTIMYKP
jgi:hypothetical protein